MSKIPICNAVWLLGPSLAKFIQHCPQSSRYAPLWAIHTLHHTKSLYRMTQAVNPIRSVPTQYSFQSRPKGVYGLAQSSFPPWYSNTRYRQDSNSPVAFANQPWWSWLWFPLSLKLSKDLCPAVLIMTAKKGLQSSFHLVSSLERSGLDLWNLSPFLTVKMSTRCSSTVQGHTEWREIYKPSKIICYKTHVGKTHKVKGA